MPVLSASNTAHLSSSHTQENAQAQLFQKALHQGRSTTGRNDMQAVSQWHS
ncbi:hypothetical protein [Alteromonas gracilis]|uniref:hypothetical protein n=1 Tax=Alteromonas gracilis TaxID=1479524 RepID=UPI0030D52616